MTNTTMVASKDIVQAVENLRNVRAMIKQLEKQEKSIETCICLYMKENDRLITDDGEEMLTWKYTKEIVSFDRTKFKSEHEEIYNQYLKVTEGSRRLLLNK